MNRYQRNAAIARRAALFWAAQALICIAAGLAASACLHPCLATFCMVVGLLQALGSLACIDEWITWRRRDRATRNTHPL